jgi:plasmid maintenance system killer protein
VQLEFANNTQELVETGTAGGTALPVEVLRAVRHRLRLIEAAPDLVTLANWKSFGLTAEPTRNGERSVTINDNWKIAVRFQCQQVPNRAILLSVNSNQ